LLVLCTGGLSNQVSDDELREIEQRFGPQESVRHLAEQANENSGPDNNTTIVVRVSSNSAGSFRLYGGLRGWHNSITEH
jgi:serine/threonine protein phosphatase PrpC